MTAPYKVDMMTESVISHMAAIRAALEAENTELKTRINDLATDWQVLRLKLETARDALGSCGKAICREQVSMIAEEALAAIGEAQPASAEVKPCGEVLVECITGVICRHITVPFKPSEAIAAAREIAGKYATPSTAQAEIEAAALEEAARMLDADTDNEVWTQADYAEQFRRLAAQKREAGK